MIPRTLALCIAAFALATLTGCGTVDLTTSTSTAPATTDISGKVHGGQQPVAGATVTLYAPGLTGYGSAPTALVSTTTGSDGSFTLPRPYTCPSTNDNLTYITATGGNSGSGTNAVLALAAVLGPCSSLSSSTFIFISEATTVAAAYTLAPFASLSGSTTTIGTSSTNLIGLKNTLGPAGNLVNTTTGNARAVSELANMVLPTAELNTLANILAACVNTAGSTAPTAACGQLFLNATPPGGSAPNNTFQAALDIALNPGNNSASLYTLSSSTAPFQPTLTTAPGDFALAIQYTGGQIYNSGITTGLAIDAQGNAWVANSGNNPSINEISPAGAFLSGSTGFAAGLFGPQAASIDQSGNVYVTLANSNKIIKLNSSGNLVQNITPSSLSTPSGIAVDNRNGSIWVANANNTALSTGGANFTGTTVTNATSAGAEAPGSPYSGGNGPVGVQIDASGNVWVANSANNTTTSNIGSISKFIPPGTSGNPYTLQNISTGQYSYPFELAFDHTGNVWVTNNSTVGKYTNSGTLLSGSGYASNANDGPFSIMIDGLGRAFASTANTLGKGCTLTVFSNSGTLISTANSQHGYFANFTLPDVPWSPSGLAIDASGNVWISGINDTSSHYGFVTEIIGIAAPITTPSSVASSTNTYGVRP